MATHTVEVVDVVVGRRGDDADWIVVDEVHTFLPGEMEALAEKIAALNRRCVCGITIVDGPFRFCIGCRQVDLGLAKHGGQ